MRIRHAFSLYFYFCRFESIFSLYNDVSGRPIGIHKSVLHSIHTILRRNKGFAELRQGDPNYESSLIAGLGAESKPTGPRPPAELVLVANVSSTGMWGRISQ